MTAILEFLHQVNQEFTFSVYSTIRGSLFSGFLTLGGLVFTSLTFTTTRLHDMLKGPAATERRRIVEALRPGVSHTSALRKSARQTRRAVTLCFITAGLQITLGLVVHPTAQAICLFMALLTGFYVCIVARRAIGVYYAWLVEFDKGLAEEDRRKMAS